MEDKVAITLGPDEPAIIVDRATALDEFKFLAGFILTQERDIQLFNALRMEFDIDKPSLTEHDPTHAERVIEEWKAQSG